MTHPKTITLGELRADLEALLALPDDTRVYFGVGDLSFNRIKSRGPVEGPAMEQFEFNEIYSVTLDLAD